MPAGAGNSSPLPLTLPFTLGQGPYSTMRVLISTDDALAPVPNWTDYTHKLRSYSFDVGRSSERSSFETGTAEIEIDNNDRALDPNAHAEVGPRNRVWLLEEFDGKTRTRFKGYVESYEQRWDRSGIKDATVVVHAADELKMLNAVKLPAFDPPSASSYMDMIGSDSPAAYYRWERQAPVRTLVSWHEQFLHRFDPWNLTGATDEVFVRRYSTTAVETDGWKITTSGYSVDNDAAVVGDLIGSSEDGPCGSLRFASGGVLDSLDSGAGDMLGSGTGGVVECWFKRSATPGSDTMFWGGPGSASFAGQRLWNFALRTTGSADFNLLDSSGTNKQVSFGVLQTNTWYHLAAGIVGGTLKAYLNGAQVASTAIPNPWASSIDDTVPMRVQYPNATVNIDEMAVFPFPGLTAARIAAHYTAGVLRGYPQQLPYLRIGSVLDTISSQAPRAIRSGTRVLHPVFLAGSSALDLISQVEAAEGPDGAFFCALDGTLTFLDAGHRSVPPWNTSQMTFDDDGTDNAYMEAEGYDENDSFIVNEWNLSRIGAGSVTQTASDATSRSRYGPSAQSISDLLLTANADMATYAAALLAKYKDPLSRVTALVPKTALPDVQSAVLDLDLMQQITVIRRPPGGGSAITQNVWIQKWSQNGTPGVPPNVKLSVSPL